jgi:exonuclease III
MHKSIVRSVLKKIVCNDRIIALKLKAEPVSTLLVQVYMPTSEYEDDSMEKLYDIIEEILEKDAKGVTNTIIIGDWKLEIKHIKTLLDHRDWEGGTREVKCSSTFLKGMNLSSPTHGLRTPGKHQEIEVDTSWSKYLLSNDSETV